MPAVILLGSLVLPCAVSAQANPNGVGVATFFGPVSIKNGDTLKACVHNLAARGRIQVKWTLLPNSSSRVPPSAAEDVLEDAIDREEVSCKQFQPSVVDLRLDAFLVKLEVIPERGASPRAWDSAGRHEPGALPSVQILNPDGTPQPCCLLPAIQKLH